jgi:hypothetical protein
MQKQLEDFNVGYHLKEAMLSLHVTGYWDNRQFRIRVYKPDLTSFAIISSYRDEKIISGFSLESTPITTRETPYFYSI